MVTHEGLLNFFKYLMHEANKKDKYRRSIWFSNRVKRRMKSINLTPNQEN